MTFVDAVIRSGAIAGYGFREDPIAACERCRQRV